jgi:hypothetical protein
MGEVDGLCRRRVGVRGAVDGNEDLAEHGALLSSDGQQHALTMYRQAI